MLNKKSLFFLFLAQCYLLVAIEAYQHDLFKNSLSFTSVENHEEEEFFHIIKKIDTKEGTIILKDQSVWRVDWWYRTKISSWLKGDRLKVIYDFYYQQIKFENIDQNSFAWGTIVDFPPSHLRDSIDHVSSKFVESSNILTLKSGWKAQCPNLGLMAFFHWQKNENIFIFHDSNDYCLFNLSRGEIIKACSLTKGPREVTGHQNISEILDLEEKLNAKVIAQKEATKALSIDLLNYAIGLNPPNAPIGVYLFIGPSGVGKTELAKVLAAELFKGQDHLIRLDMSQFSEKYSAVRLIGSPPGYMDHDQGGQLTEPLKEKPKSVVLLDEIEKAHPEVHKYFLPVFDEGYICDSNNVKISCQEVIFIMTSNLCSQKIKDLFNAGYNSNEILKKIEPELIEKLSPELYNRIKPVLFLPLQKKDMKQLVKLLLDEAVLRIKQIKGISLEVDSTVVDFLYENGFHSELGARPLKRLIESTVIANVALSIAKEGIPNGSTLTLSYLPLDESWHVHWLRDK